MGFRLMKHERIYNYEWYKKKQYIIKEIEQDLGKEVSEYFNDLDIDKLLKICLEYTGTYNIGNRFKHINKKFYSFEIDKIIKYMEKYVVDSEIYIQFLYHLNQVHYINLLIVS